MVIRRLRPTLVRHPDEIPPKRLVQLMHHRLIHLSTDDLDTDVEKPHEADVCPASRQIDHILFSSKCLHRCDCPFHKRSR